MDGKLGTYKTVIHILLLGFRVYDILILVA